MSHFTVLVIGANVDELLAPYDENMEVHPYPDPLSDEDVKRMKEYYAEKGLWQESAGLTGLMGLMQDWNETNGMIIDGKLHAVSTYNPKSKWDWWMIGGRWAGMLKLLPGGVGRLGDEKSWAGPQDVQDGCVDQALKCYVDFTPDEKQYQERVRAWSYLVDGYTPATTEERHELMLSDSSPRALRQTYRTAEEYARVYSSFSTYAVVTEDGEWHEQGKMGWFGMSSATEADRIRWKIDYMKRFIEPIPQTTMLTIVDCHI